MSDHEQPKRPRRPVESGPMARGPQIRVSVSQALKDHVEETAGRLGYPSAAELVREAIVFRLALLAVQENKADVEAAERMLRRLLNDLR